MASAKCFHCVPRGTLREVMVYLLCQWDTEPTTDDFTFAIVAHQGVITVTGNAPTGVAGFQSRFKLKTGATWVAGYSNAPGSTALNTFPPDIPGEVWEAQIQWATSLGNPVSAWSPSRYFTS